MDHRDRVRSSTLRGMITALLFAPACLLCLALMRDMVDKRPPPQSAEEMVKRSLEPRQPYEPSLWLVIAFMVSLFAPAFLLPFLS
jgi:hypothetical protein